MFIISEPSLNIQSSNPSSSRGGGGWGEGGGDKIVWFKKMPQIGNPQILMIKPQNPSQQICTK
jgi:hypothetical protein